MLLTGHILTLTNDGAPDYNICGQATSLLNFINTSFKLSISKGGSAVTTLINTTDLSTLIVGTLPYTTITYGDYDINFAAFAKDNTTSSYSLDIRVYATGTTDIVTWEKFNVFIEISKSGYQSYINGFELYNYDVGNDATLGYSGNTDFDIILVNDTNNIDSFGTQTRAGSNFIALRRPFTKEVHFYSMIATQGNIEYTNTDDLTVLGYGKHGIVISEEDINITQTVTLSNSDTCTQDQGIAHKVWLPVFTVNYTSEDSCGDCTNTLAQTTVSYTSDASTTSIFKVNNVLCFLSEFMTEEVLIETYNYLGVVIDSNTATITLTYFLWISSPSTFLNPTDYVFTPSEIGDNVIKITHKYSSVAILYECYNTFLLPTCNWWTVTPNEDCNSYTVNNCNADDITVVLQKLNDDKTYTTISTTPLTSFTNAIFEFSEDGIYVLRVNKDSTPSTFEYYTLPIYCALQECLMNYIALALCDKVTDDCKEKATYTFNTFLISAHTYFLLLNQELNYNFIYTTISVAKTEELYVLSTFITRFSEYCLASNSPCLPCND